MGRYMHYLNFHCERFDGRSLGESGRSGARPWTPFWTRFRIYSLSSWHSQTIARSAKQSIFFLRLTRFVS